MADVDINKFRASVVREGSKPASPGFIVSEGQSPTDPAGSGQNHLPVTIATAATGLSITESQVLGGAGNVGQYIRGDGSLADFPESSGGGSSVSYYLNGSVAQGTIGGVAYKELNKVPILGAGTDFSISADGYIASFITDAGDPNLLEIPGGNWNFETYFSASSSGGTPTFYVELYKVNSGGTATLIASNSGFPELIAFGTNIISYFSTLAVPTTALALTDRLAIRYYVTHSGRTITLHTEDNHLCQIITTFTTGLTAINGLTAQIQNFAVGTSGTDFAIASATATHTFNLPTASATNRGALSSADWTTFNGKQNALTNPVTGTGASGQVAYFTGTSAISSESNLFWDATNDRLGIGAPSPLYKLDVRRSGTTSGEVFSVGNTGSGDFGGLAVSDGGSYPVRMWATQLEFYAGNSAYASASEAMRIFSSTNVHIGPIPASDNGARLQVSGTATFSSNIAVGGTITSLSDTDELSIFAGTTIVDNRARIELYGPSHATLANQTFVRGSQIVFTSSAAATEYMRFASTGAATFTSNIESTSLTASIVAGRTTGYGYFGNLTGGAYSIVYGDSHATKPNRIEISGAGGVYVLNAANFSSTVTATSHVIDRTGSDSITTAFYQQDTLPSTANAINMQMGASGGFQFHTFNGSWNNRMTITSIGNVGIGTVSPTDYGVSYRTLEFNAPSFPVFNMSSGGTRQFSIVSSTSESLLGTFTNTPLIFYTNSIPQMRITSVGNVGIGTDSPSSYNNNANDLVVGTTSGNNGITIVGQNNAFSCLFFADGTTGTDAFRGFIQYNHTGDNFEIGTSGNERMRITSGGSVGINNTSPVNTAWGSETSTKQLSINGSSYAVINLEGSTGRKYSMGVGDGNYYMCYDNTAGRHNITVSSGGNVLINTTTSGSSKLRIVGLPTSSAGLSSGDVWSDSGTLKIA